MSTRDMLSSFMPASSSSEMENLRASRAALSSWSGWLMVASVDWSWM